MPAEPHDTEPVPDVLSLDLESLRTVDHPVLSALVTELRARVTESDSQALWGFQSAM
jgi:FXSXX-COOH protein